MDILTTFESNSWSLLEIMLVLHFTLFGINSKLNMPSLLMSITSHCASIRRVQTPSALTFHLNSKSFIDRYHQAENSYEMQTRTIPKNVEFPQFGMNEMNSLSTQQQVQTIKKTKILREKIDRKMFNQNNYH